MRESCRKSSRVLWDCSSIRSLKEGILRTPLVNLSVCGDSGTQEEPLGVPEELTTDGSMTESGKLTTDGSTNERFPGESFLNNAFIASPE